MRLLAIAAISLALSCAPDPEVRAQTVLVIDTDFATVAAPGEVSPALVDTLRIEVMDGSVVRDSRDLVVPDPSSFPVSIGVVGASRLRLRLFRSPTVTSEITIDRLVDLAAPAAGEIRRRRVLLTGECVGFPADLANGLTCTGRGTPAAPAADAMTDDDGSPSQVGSWSALRPAPCTSAADADRPCVPGSFDVIGDLALVYYAESIDIPAPLRPVVVSPFRMDRTEFTVGRYRAIRSAGYQPAADPQAAGADLLTRYCTFVSLTNSDNDSLPLNCISQSQAAEICHAAGGELPSEAQWEHAARGRDGRAFPWGDAEPECCTTSLSRIPLDLSAANLATCGHGALEPVGSHVMSTAMCSGGGDVSRDGIVDLGGSLSELTRDGANNVSVCAGKGLAHDPECPPMFGSSSTFVTKGGDFTAGLLRARSGFRSHDAAGSYLFGFRCVYPESAAP